MFERLYKNWVRLGVGFLAEPTASGSVDLEATILATARAGREDSRLLFGMQAWLMKHHDLVNNSRLIHLVKRADETAVLGAVIDFVLAKAPRSTLRYVRKYCKKAAAPEFVFKRIADSVVQSALNREENLTIWKTWNLISREIGEMDGVIREKSYVYAHNRNLALRALFGPIAKAEVLAYLLEHKASYARQIAQAIGLSYEPVYSELLTFLEMGFVREEKSGKGKARLFKIRPEVRNRMRSLLAV